MSLRAIAISLSLAASLVSSSAFADDEPVVPVGLPPPPGAPPRGGPLPPPPPTELYSPTLVAVGATFLVGGAASVVTGGVLFWNNGRDVYEKAVSAVHGPDTGAMIGGGIAMLIGIPLVVIGAIKVPQKTEPMAKSTVPAIPAITASRGGAAFTWRF